MICFQTLENGRFLIMYNEKELENTAIIAVFHDRINRGLDPVLPQTKLDIFLNFAYNNYNESSCSGT